MGPRTDRQEGSAFEEPRVQNSCRKPDTAGRATEVWEKTDVVLTRAHSVSKHARSRAHVG